MTSIDPVDIMRGYEDAQRIVDGKRSVYDAAWDKMCHIKEYLDKQARETFRAWDEEQRTQAAEAELEAAS